MFLQPIETIQIFKNIGQAQRFNAGETIFKEGDRAVAIYGIVSGEVEVTVGDRSVETIQTGDIFGVGALVHPDFVRSSTVTAKTNCEIIALDREHFLFAVQETPIFSLEVMRSYSNRLRKLRQVKAS